MLSSISGLLDFALSLPDPDTNPHAYPVILLRYPFLRSLHLEEGCEWLLKHDAFYASRMGVTLESLTLPRELTRESAAAFFFASTSSGESARPQQSPLLASSSMSSSLLRRRDWQRLQHFDCSCRHFDRSHVTLLFTFLMNDATELTSLALQYLPFVEPEGAFRRWVDHTNHRRDHRGVRRDGSSSASASERRPLRHLSLHYCRTITQDDIEGLVSLESLSIAGCKAITSVSFCGASLRHLIAYDSGITDDGLREATRLTSLNVAGCAAVTTVAPFGSTLRHLVATGARCGLGDSGLVTATNLTSLECHNNPRIQSCRPFQDTLWHLSAGGSNSGITDDAFSYDSYPTERNEGTEPLSRRAAPLHTLCLSGNKAVTQLRFCDPTRLRELRLGDFCIVPEAELVPFVNLVYLDLGSNSTIKELPKQWKPSAAIIASSFPLWKKSSLSLRKPQKQSNQKISNNRTAAAPVPPRAAPPYTTLRVLNVSDYCTLSDASLEIVAHSLVSLIANNNRTLSVLPNACQGRLLHLELQGPLCRVTQSAVDGLWALVELRADRLRRKQQMWHPKE